MRRFRVFLAVFVVLLAFAPSASAHLVFVTPPGEGNGTVRWVGAGGAAHGHGLVRACERTTDEDSPSAAVFLAPATFTRCEHHPPPSP